MGKEISLIAFLDEVVSRNTQHYRKDFELDAQKLRDALNSPYMDERIFYFMSRPMKRPPMFTSSAGESSTTHLNSQTATTGIIGETVSMSRGRIRKNTPAWRPHSIISKAGLTCIVTCSEKSPHQSPMSADGCSVSTAIWRQGTRWLHQIRKNPTRRPLMTCWPVWMTRMPQYLQRRSRKCIFLKRRLNAKSPFQ